MVWTISGQCPSMNWTKCRSSGLYHLINVLDAFLFSVVQNVIDSSIVIVGDTILFETGTGLNWIRDWWVQLKPFTRAGGLMVFVL